MVKILIGEKEKNRAKELYNFDVLNNSFTKGKGNIFGAIGEVCVYDYLNVPISNQKHDYNFDLEYYGETYDIKAKKCTSIPQNNYTCSVALTSLHQQCDNYIFVRVREDIDEVYILGYISKKNFIDKGFFLAKGSYDEYGFKVKNDCINVFISQLNDISELKNNVILDLDYIKNNFTYNMVGNYVHFSPNINIKCFFRPIDCKLNIYQNNQLIYEENGINIASFLKKINYNE